MIRKKDFIFNKALGFELASFFQDKNGTLCKAEKWGDELKKLIIEDAKKNGVFVSRSDINIVWNDLVLEYILYIKGDFCGYFDFSFFENNEME